MIKFIQSDQIKVVTKPWGNEKWIQQGSNVYPYVLKEIYLKAGNRTSLQVHQFKSESIVILSGTGTLLTYDIYFDCEKFVKNEYTNDELNYIKNNLQTINLIPNSVFHTPPGTIHRMIAITDLLYIEASTQELDDVIRLEDDQNRNHGKIDSEHV
jgi:mannose-6-phosphate isomerase-like protein (cupin superfamily)